MGLPYGNHIPQPDGIFSTACLSTGSFRNGYIGVFRFDCRRLCRTADGRIQLIHIDGIGSGRTGCHVGNLLIVGIEAAVVDIGLSAYMDAVVVDHRIARCDAVHFHVFRQFDIQRIFPVGYHADISVCQLRRICHAADNIRLFA